MSSSRQFPGGKKSKFGLTCNLLSRFIKSKGSLKSFNVEVDGRIECLESMMKSGWNHTVSSSGKRNSVTQMEQSAQRSMDSPPEPAKMEETADKDTRNKEAKLMEPKSAQLTIFYAGRILVFDNCSTDKANELLNFALKVCPQTTPGGASEGVCLKSSIISNPCESDDRRGAAPMAEAAGSDLPIARRSSVHRFLDKRKERAAARGPYQTQEVKNDDQLDLNH